MRKEGADEEREETKGSHGFAVCPERMRNVTHTERERERVSVCVCVGGGGGGGGRIRVGRHYQLTPATSLIFPRHTTTTLVGERDKQTPPQSQRLPPGSPLTLGSVLSLFFHLFLLR